MKDDERTYLIELATRAGFEPDSIETMTSMGDAHGVLPVIALILLHLDGDARRDDLERYKEWSKRYLLTALAIEVRDSLKATFDAWARWPRGLARWESCFDAAADVHTPSTPIR